MNCRCSSLAVWVVLGMIGNTASVSGQTNNSVQISPSIGNGTGPVLRWQSATGTAYTVQFQDTLQDGIWRLPLAPFPVTVNPWSEASITNLSRLYRVIGVPGPRRGLVLSSTLTQTMSTFQLGILFSAAGLPITPQYNVRLYKVDYETCTPLGARTVASGALLLPLGVGKPLPLVSYQHGTLTQTNAAPSSMNLSGEVSIGIAFASAGYAVAVPDYLGLGDSPGLHPYLHARSEATACVDMLRAVKSFCATNGFSLTNRLFLCGYSQGGHATMALLRELEMFHTNEFSVTACAPMAGPYDLSGVTMADFLSGRVQPNPYYFLYLLAAYQDVYHFAPSLGSMLAPPYDATLPPLVSGATSGGQINAGMPADPLQILKPEYLADFNSNPRHPLRLALQDNDLYRWKPSAPLRLYHCAGDQDVIKANSQVALAAFQAAGATQVQLIDPAPSDDHGSCAEPSLLLAKQWFDSLR